MRLAEYLVDSKFLADWSAAAGLFTPLVHPRWQPVEPEPRRLLSQIAYPPASSIQ